MHEWGLVQSLLARADEEARKHGATAVKRLEISIGELAGVEPALFDSAYELFRTDTLCEGAALELRYVPADWACERCDAPIARGTALRRPACHGAARLRAGDGIVLERMELEVP